MKRAFRVAIVLVPVTVLLIGIGLWRHHYHKIMDAEPEKVYKSVPLQPNNLPTDANTPKVTPVENEDDTNVEIEVNETTQGIDEMTSPPKKDNTDNLLGDATLDEIAEQPTLSPEAAAALKEYEEINSEYLAVYNELQPLLNARPIDWNAISLVNEKIRKVKQQRIDALSKLAVYSDEALEELVDTIAQEDEAAGIMAENKSELEREYSPALLKLLDNLKTMSTEERKRVLETLPDLMEK